MMAMVGNLAQVCQDAEVLLTIDVSDDLTPIGLQTSEKPVVPSGADDLVAYYEKQLAATQLVQHRLEKQCHQLAEEKLALETSLTVQTSALQQQLVLAREKAERAFAQAEHAQQQVHDAHAAVGDVVDAVTHLAELLDVSGATKELTQSFEAVARSTQHTFQAIAAAQEGAQVMLELQLGAREACQVSPLFTAVSAGGHHEADAMRKLEEDAIRLRKELDDTRRREQELEAEMRAAQVLFSGLEAEVVSLQHDQAQAAAKLQLSQEELLAARDEIIVAQQALIVAQSPAAGVLTQGLAKLDEHLASVRSFLDELSMPQPPVIDDLGCSNLQLHAGRSRDGNSVARNPAMSGDMRASPESGTFLRQLEASPQHLRSVMAVALDGSSISSFIQGVVRRALLRDQIDAEQALVSEQPGAQAEGQEAARHQLSDHSAVLSRQMAFVAKERDVLRSCTAELASLITSLEIEKEGMLRNRAQQLGMAAAAGAAGAAAAVAVATDAGISTATPSLSQSPSVIEAGTSASLAHRVNEVVLATFKERLRGSESAIAAVAAERDTAVERSECLAEEVETLRELLQQGMEGQDGACRLLERLIADRAAAGSQFLDKKPALSAKPGALKLTAVDMAVSADLSAAQYSDVPLPGSPSSPVSRSSPSRTRRCRSDISIVSDSHMVNEARDLFFEQGEPLREMSRAYTLSSTAVQSSYQSFTSEAPLVPTRRYTDDSHPHTYLLDPTEPLEELLPTPAGSGPTVLNRGGGGGGGGGGVAREGGRDLRRSHRNSHGGHDVQSLLAEVAQLQAAVCSLVISKSVTYAELQVESEQNLAAMREAHQAEMASLREEYLAEIGQLQALVAGSADVLVSAPMPHLTHGRYLDKATSVLEDDLPGGQYEAELLQHSASLEIRILEMEEQQKRLVANYEDQLRIRGELELRLADAASCLQQEVDSRGAHDTEMKSLQMQILELRDQLASQLAEHKVVLAELDTLNAEANRHRTAAEEQQRKLEDCEGELLLRESLVGELRGELQRLQSEKELEEQSFQSLLSTKSWMSEEIRSLQAQLKETSSKLALAEAELARLRIAGSSGNLLGTGRQLIDASSLPSQQESNDEGDGTFQRAMPVPPGIYVKLATHETGSNVPGIVASSCGVKVQASPAISLAADQLAEAAMQAALAETKLEILQSQQQAEMGNTPKVAQPLSERSMERTNLMMETVALQGELDTLRGQHRTLHSKLDAVADELAYTVMRASLAELQLEHLRLERAGTVSSANTISPRANQQNLDYAPRASQPAGVVSRAAITPVKPEQLLLGIDAADLFGTDAFALIQQARQLYKELRMVRRALGEVMVTDAFVQSSVDRDALSSAWEVAITAQDRAANLARALQQQHQRTMATKQDADGPACSFSGDEQPVEKGHDTPFTANSQQSGGAWARDAYRDTSEVYEMLRSDAEEINNQLWRWSIKLHQHLSAKEAELTCAQAKSMPGTQLAFESLLSRKEAYVRSVEGQVSELQAGLHAAHSQLLHRAGQVATLQDMLVQLSEQDSASIGSFETDAEADIEKLKDLISGLQEQLKAKHGELRAARYASLVVHQRAEARSGKPLSDAGDESPISSGDHRARGAQAGSRVTTPTFSYLLAARSQALRSPAAAMGGLSTVQVALIAAEREVLSLRSQLSHRQQHIKLLEQRLLEQSQDIAAMCNRGDALASSPVASRKASFVERRLGLGTEALLPQKAWDFDGLDMSCASGNLAEQMRPQDVRMGGDDNGTSRFIQVPLGEEDESSDGARSETERRKPSSGFQGHVSGNWQQESRESIISLSNLLVERDRIVQQLRAQINEYRAVLAAAAGSRHGQGLGHRQQVHPSAVLAQSIAEFNPRITLEDLPEGYPEWSDGSQGRYAGDAQAAGSSSIPPPFRLSSGGPLPFQMAAEMDGVRNAASGLKVCGADAGSAASTSCPTSTGTGELSRSSSSRVLDVLKRQLDEAAQMLESSQDQLARTTSELTALQDLMDALSKADPSAAHSPMPGAGSVAPPDDAQLPLMHQVSFQEVRARITTGSGLGPSTTKLNELRAQLLDVMKAIQCGQDHLLAMQAEAGVKEGSIARLSEQLKALRVYADAPLVEGVGAVLTSEPTPSQRVVAASGTDGCAVHIATATPLRPLSPSAEVNVVTPLSPSQRPAINSDADTYTPSLVMNPTFRWDAIGSSDTGSDAVRMAAFFSSTSAATGEGCFGAALDHGEADPSTTVHRNLLFDEDGLQRTKDATARLDSGIHEISAMARELELCTQQLREAKHQVSAAEAFLAEERSTRQRLEQQLAEAEGAILAFRVGQKQAQPRADEWEGGELDRHEDETRGQEALRARVGALESELQVATQRLNASTRELTATAVDLEASTHRLAEASAIAAAVEADLEAERRTRQQLEQQIAGAVVGRTATAINGQRAIMASVEMGSQSLAPIAAESDTPPFLSLALPDQARQNLKHSTESPHAEPRLKELLEALADARERTETLSEAYLQTQVELDAALVARDAALTCVEELRTANKKAQAEVERLSSREEAQWKTMELGAKPDGMNDVVGAKLGSEEHNGQLHQDEEQVHALQAQVKEQSSPLQAVGLARAGEHLESMEAALAAAQSVNNSLWLQLASIASAIGMDVSTVQQASSSRGTARTVQDGDVTTGFSDAGLIAGQTSGSSRVSESQLTYGHLASTVPGNGDGEHGHGLARASTTVASFGMPTSQHRLHEDDGNLQLSQVWSVPLNFKTALLCGAARSAAAALQSVDDVPITPSSKSVVLHSSMLSQSSQEMAAVRLGHSVDSPGGELTLITAGLRSSSESHGDACTQQPPMMHLQEGQKLHAALQGSLGQCGLQLLQPEYATSVSSIAFDTAGSQAIGNGEAYFTVVPDVAAAVQEYLDTVYADASVVRAQFEADLQLTRSQIAAALKQVAELREKNEDLVRERENWRSSFQQQSDTQQEEGAHDHNVPDIQVVMTADLSFGNVKEGQAHDHANVAHVKGLGAGSAAQCDDMEADRLDKVKHLADAHADILGLQEQLSVETTALMQRQTAEVKTSRNGPQQQLDVADVNHDTLQGKLDATGHIHMENADSGQGMVEKQLAEAHVKIEALLERVSTAEEVAASAQQQVVQVEESHLNMLQQLNASEAARDALQTELDSAVGLHAATAAELEAVKASLQQYKDAECATANKELAEAHIMVEGLKDRLSAAEKSVASLQQQVAGSELLRVELLQQLEVANMARGALQAELSRGVSSHAAAVAEVGAAQVLMQQKYDHLDSSHAMVEKQLMEERTMTKVLQEDLSTNKEVAASAQQQVSELETSRAILLQQLEAAGIVHKDLQVELDKAVGIHAAAVMKLEAEKMQLQQQYDHADSGRAMAEKQLEEARAMIQALLERLSTAEDLATSRQQQVIQVEASRAQVLQQFDAAQVAHGALQAELDRAVGTHAATVSDLAAAKASLQQQYEIAESGRTTAEKQLAEVRNTVEGLEERLSSTGKAVVSLQQQVVELESSRAELLQELGLARTAHIALHGELNKAVASHSAAIMELEASRVSLQQYNCAESGRVTAEQQLSEAHAVIKDLKERLSAVEETVATLQQQVGEVESSRVDLGKQLEAVEIARVTLQRELDRVTENHAAAVLEYEGTKMLLQQQFKSVDADRAVAEQQVADARATAEQQLTEARATIEALLEDKSMAQETVTSMQQQVLEVEASRAKLQQQLDTVLLSYGTLQADMDMAARAHGTVVAELEAAKISLQQQYKAAEFTRLKAEQQLEEACTKIEDLQKDLSTTMGTVAVLQQRVVEMEASRAELQHQLVKAEASRDALQTDFDVAAQAHATAVADFEATNVSLQQQFDDVKAGRGMAEQKLEEARATIKALLEQMSVTQKTGASMQQRVMEVEASHTELQQRLDVAEVTRDAYAKMVIELEAAKESLQQRCKDADAGRAIAMQHLEEACAKMQVLEHGMPIAKEMCSSMQQQIDVMETSRTELLQQLRAVEESQKSLHAELEEADRAYSATVAELEAAKLALQQECVDANAGRVKAEQQLADAQAIVEDLQQRVSAAGQAMTFMQQPMAQVEALCTQLQRLVAAAEANRSILQTDSRDATGTFAAAVVENEADKGYRASLTYRLEMAGQEAVAHAVHAEKLAESLAYTQALVAKLECLLAESNAELQALTERAQELEEQLGDKEQRLLEQELDRRVVAQELEALQQRVAELQVDVESARDNAESVSVHLDEYKVISRQQCMEAEQARADAIMDAAAVREELASLRTALLVATSETEAHRNRLAAVEVELSKVESQMESLQCGICSSEAQADELRGELAAVQYDLMSTRDERDDAMRQLNEGSLKLIECQQQLDRLRQELDKAGVHQVTLSQKLAETLAELSAARDERQVVVTQANTDIEVVKQHLAESQAMLTTSQGELQGTVNELADTRRQLLAAFAERDSVKAQLSEVHAAKQAELLGAMKELGEAQKQLQTAWLERDTAATKMAEAVAEKQMELMNALKELAEARKQLHVAFSDRDTAAAQLTEALTERQTELLGVTTELVEARKQLLAALSDRDILAVKLAEAQNERQTELLGVTTELSEARKQLQAALSECSMTAAKMVEVQADKQTELQSLTAGLAEAGKLHQAALSERDAAAAKLADAEMRLVSAREAVDAKRVEHEATVKLLESALAAKDNACSDLSNIRSELLTAVRMLSEVRDERDSVMSELEDMQIEARSLQDRVSILVKQLTDAQSQAQKASEQRDLANGRIVELEGQLVVTGQLLGSAHEAIESRRAEHQADVKLLDLALADKSSLRIDLEGMQSQILAALNELSDARAQRDAVMQQLNAVRDVLAVIEEERSSATAAAVATAAVMREQQRTVEVQQRNLDASRASEASRVAEHLRALELRADELKQYAEDLQHRLIAAEAHLSLERTEAKVVHSRLELQLTSARAELESIAADRTSALQQLAATRTELLQVTSSCADLQEKVNSLEQLSQLLQGQLDINKQKLLDAESRVAAERLSAETAQTKAEELQGKLCADLAAAHAELMAVAAQRNALEAQLTVVLPTLGVAQAEHAAGLRQISHMKGDHAILESHLVPLEEYGKVLEQQAENLRQQLSRAEAQHAAERADTQSAISQLEAQLDAVRTELVAATSARDVSAQQVGNLRSENLEFAAAHAKLEVQLRLLQEHVEQLQQQAGSLQDQLTGAEACLLGERAEAHSARTQAAAVRAELAAVMAERDTLASRAAALTTELASVRVSYESIVQQQEVTVQAKATLEEQVRSHEQHTAQLQSQLGDIACLREHLQETEAKFVAERECRIATERLLATAKTEVSEVHGELAMLRKELAAVTKKLTAQQALTESRVGEMQVKVAQARAQASEESDKVYHLQQELAEMEAALKGAQQHLLDRDVDAKGMVTGLQEALETTRATLEAERARGEQKAKELQELLHKAITREASAHEKLDQLRDELDAACAAQQASQAAAEMDIASLKEELLDAQRALHSAKQAALDQEAELKASLQAANKMAAASQQRVACLDTQVMEIRTAESEAQRALAEARHSMDQKEAGAARQIASLKASLADAQEAIAGLETHQKRAEDANRIAEGEVVVMGDKLREERKRASLLEPRIEELAEEVAVLQAELSNARTALSRYEAYALDAEAEIQELRSAAEVSSEENLRLQQQLDQLVEQLRRQTQQLRAAETDAAQLRQEVAAMNLMGARRSRSTTRGQSAERRHGSAGRAVAGGRASGGATSILEDSAKAQQLLILRKTHQTSRHPSPAVMSVGSGSNSTASRTGEGKAAFGQRARPRAGSIEPRPPPSGATLEQQPVDTSANPGPGTRSLSPASLLQKRLTDEATQLRWEVVADSSRIRELQEKRAGGVYLNRAEVAEMELLTARLGAHHARISAIMDTVKLARGQQPQGVMEQANMTPTSGGFESCRSPARADVPSDLEFPDQPRQQPVFHPHPPAHPPVRYSFGEVGIGGTGAMAGLDAHAVMQRSPQAASHESCSRGFRNGSEPLETPSRMRFFDLETRAKPAELPRTTFGTNELHLAQREALGRRDEIRPIGTPKDLHRLGNTTPNQDVDLMRGGVEYRSGNSKEQVQNTNDSISPHAMEFVYGTFPSPSSQSARSTLAIINVSPWYPPGATPGRVISPVRAASPASMAGGTLTGAAESREHYGGHTGRVTPVRERDREGKPKPHITDTDEVLGGVSPLLPTVGGEALEGGLGAGAGPRAATRYRTPYLKMLQDMVLLGQIGGGKRGGIVVGATHDAGPSFETHMPSHGSMNAVVQPHYGRGDAGIEAIGHWGSGGGADGSQGPVASYGSPGARGQSPCKEHPNRPVYMPSGVGPGRACD